MAANCYFELDVEESWTEYLRTRLPYSFKRMERDSRNRNRRYVLSEPCVLKGIKASEYHNFWQRGNISYMAGKLLDYYSISDPGRYYRMLEGIRLYTQRESALRQLWPMNLYAFYNSMQMEKVWRIVLENHLDRERVVLSNVLHAVELCLKAVETHASFRENMSFSFREGHDVTDIYEGLPSVLREEIILESKSFAREYVAFRKQVEADFQMLQDRWRSHSESSDSANHLVEDWVQMEKRIRESCYTAFINCNDPGANQERLHKDWFEEALNRIKSVKSRGGISVYFRYAPFEEKDELPVDLLDSVLLMGRFLYEHLFPVQLPDSGPLLGFPAVV